MNKLARLPTIDRAARASARHLRRVRRRRARYFAFLSYSHKDEELAEWLHSQLERFRVPSTLAGRLTENGVIPKRLTPIFRDQHELAAAGDLGEEIEEALANTQFLIVLCSPAAAKSHWTNAEIETFKRTRPDGCVLAAIAEGEPFASDTPGREAEECFPPALRHKFDRRGRPTGRRAEPLAADLRGEGEARRLGLLKLIAGMLGVGLDDLVQRETTRRQRRLAMVAAASVAGMAITSTLAITAIQARDAAREQRREAEGLVSFMLGDLKDKLEPIGRLDALDGVGARVLAYYKREGTGDLSDPALLQRSRALSLMGQVAYLRGKMDAAMRFYREAMAGTAEAIRRNPDDPQRLYEHAQNVFWVAALESGRGNLTAAESGMREYKRLAQEMIARDPNNMQWRMEDQDADVNLGFVLYDQRRFAESVALFRQAVQMIQAFATADPRNGDYQQQLAESLAWLADAQMSSGHLDEAIAVRQQHVALIRRLITQSHSDVQTRQRLIPAEESLGLFYEMRGQSTPAVAHLRAAIAAADELVPIEPGNTLWQEYAMAPRFDLGEALLPTDKAEATKQIEAGCAVAQQLFGRDAAYPSWRAGARTCWTDRAKIAAAAGRKDEALSDARRAVALTPSGSMKGVDDRYNYSRAYLVLGDVLQSVGDTAGAAMAWQKALSALPPNVAERPYELAQHVTILNRLGRAGEAQPLKQKLDAMGYRAADKP